MSPLALLLLLAAPETSGDFSLPKLDGAGEPKNILFILTDDHRYDAMGFMGHPFLETPNMDRIAREGTNFTAGYVTTALCSPSRASILTGQYAHKHKVVDNGTLVPDGTIFFPQYLQAAGYRTGFFGKWHMGAATDAPRPGFDRWVSFRGQGHYYPHKSGFNVDGKRVKSTKYVTDELTDYATEWLKEQPVDEPFFCYLSHKAVHANFAPAERHAGRYADEPVAMPVTFADTPENYADKPRWVQDQRNSWHGVEYAYHTSAADMNVKDYYRRYCETLLAVDESIGRMLALLEERGQLKDTLVVYMGDNGFMFGEHGLIDKRCAYEASMRVPYIAMLDGVIPAGESSDMVVANIDIAPTCLAVAGLQTPEHMDGANFLPQLTGEASEPWRDTLLYEYFWERTFPQTPTQHALRTPRYKYIRYYGVWDTDELYDMQTDPYETTNLAADPANADLVKSLHDQMFAEMKRTDGMTIPLYPGHRGNELRDANAGRAHDIPSWYYRDGTFNRNAKRNGAKKNGAKNGDKKNGVKKDGAVKPNDSGQPKKQTTVRNPKTKAEPNPTTAP